jgi:hypothetical protein
MQKYRPKCIGTISSMGYSPLLSKVINLHIPASDRLWIVIFYPVATVYRQPATTAGNVIRQEFKVFFPIFSVYFPEDSVLCKRLIIKHLIN